MSRRKHAWNAFWEEDDSSHIRTVVETATIEDFLDDVSHRLEQLTATIEAADTPQVKLGVLLASAALYETLYAWREHT